MRSQPCPICNAPAGFHDDEPHEQARALITAELLLPTGTAVRAAVRAERRARYEQWRADQAAGV